MCGRRLSAPGDCTRPSVERPQSEQKQRQGEGRWRKLKAKMDLLKGEEEVAIEGVP